MNAISEVCLLLLIVVSIVRGQQYSDASPPFRRTEVRDDLGQYAFSYETRDGTVINEQGRLKQGPNGAYTVLSKQGSYFYLSPDGTPIKLSYIADDLGFRPQGAHLPRLVHPLPVS